MIFSKRGIHFNYHGDEMVWVWPWKRTEGQITYIGSFYSTLYDQRFKNLNDYWFYAGAYTEAMKKKKMIGYSEFDIFKRWAELAFRHDIVVILRNINVEMKSTKFWRSIDRPERNELLKDCPVLFFRDQTEAWNVVESVEPEFAEAYLFLNGQLCFHNNEIKTKSLKKSDYFDWAGPQRNK